MGKTSVNDSCLDGMERSTAIDMMWLPYEKDYFYWKFVAMFFEKLSLVVITTLLEDRPITALWAVSAIIWGVFALSCYLRPFHDAEEDRVDIGARLDQWDQLRHRDLPDA